MKILTEDVCAALEQGWKPKGIKPFYEDDYTFIIHGDCREILDSLTYDFICSDPPYNIGFKYESYNDKLSEEQYAELLRFIFNKNCCIIHYPEDQFKISWILEEIPQEIVTWVYNSQLPKQSRLICWYFCKPDLSKVFGEYKNPNDKRILERIENGFAPPIYDWWEIQQVKNISDEKTEHPCQIPIQLIKRILQTTSFDVVLDPFMGSGTTLRAAKDLRRKSIGIEIEEKYCEIAAKRLAQEVLAL